MISTMAGRTRWLVFFYFTIFTLTRGDDELRWNTPPKLTTGSAGEKNENDDTIQPRFLPFSASFSLATGENKAHSLSVGGNHEGISLSQSASQNDRLGPLSNSGVLATSQSSSFSAGLSGISASDASAFDLNHPVLGGTSQADSNSFSFGKSTASSYGKVEKGKVTSGAYSSVGNSQSSIYSGAERGGSSAEANANYLQIQNQNQRYGRPYWNNISPNYENGGYGSSNPYRPTLQIGLGPQSWSPNNWRRPSQLDISVDDNRWYPRVPEVRITDGWQYEYRPWNSYGCYRRPYGFSNSREEYEWNSRCSRNVNRYQKQDNHPQSSESYPLQTSSPFWTNQHHQKPGLQISAASANSGASSTANGFSFGQSSSQGNFGPQGPSSSTFNHVQTSGSSHSNAQGTAAAVHQNSNGKVEASFGSSAIVGSSVGNGGSIGTSTSGNRKGNSMGQVINQVNGSGSIHGTANSGSVSSANFPKVENSQIIPSEFVRSKQISNDRRYSRKFQMDPVDQFVSEIADTVVEILDI